MRYVTERRAADEAAGRLGPWPREDDLVVHRYHLPNDRPCEGWAILTIGSDGTFTAISDWGDYAHWWGNIGGDGDLRRFLLRASEDPDYFLRKLADGRTEYDGEETLKEIQAYLREAAEDGQDPPHWLPEEQERLRNAEKDILEGEHGFEEWCEDTAIEEPWDFHARKPPQQCVAFVKRVLAHPRFQNILRGELGLPILPIAVAA